jgi:hypothetical protein
MDDLFLLGVAAGDVQSDKTMFRLGISQNQLPADTGSRMVKITEPQEIPVRSFVLVLCFRKQPFSQQVPPRLQLSRFGAAFALSTHQEKRMSQELSFKTAICTDYERLLIACHNALELWRNRRAEISASRSVPKEAGDELLRLQANYAKAYSRVEKHADNCELCRFVSKIGGGNNATISIPVPDRRHVN